MVFADSLLTKQVAPYEAPPPASAGRAAFERLRFLYEVLTPHKHRSYVPFTVRGGERTLPVFVGPAITH